VFTCNPTSAKQNQQETNRYRALCPDLSRILRDYTLDTVSRIWRAEDIVQPDNYLNINNYWDVITTVLNMRSPGIRLHKLALFGWAVVVTAVLLLLSLPVLAGVAFSIPLALNLAVFWELLNINLIQSEGNTISLDLLGILRDYTPELICYIMVFKSYALVKLKGIRTYNTAGINQQKKNKFNSYLAGLIEGDGTIIVPKSERSPKGVLNYPSIQIVFHLKDLPLALLIQKNLGHGSLARKKGVNAYIFTVNNKVGLLLLVSLINGYMRTPKINALWKLIDWLNMKDPNLDYIKKPLNTSPLITDAWLSGLIEADGHFAIRSTQNDKYTKVECKFELSQSQKNHNGESSLYFLENIAELLSTIVNSIRIDKPNPEYKVRTTNLRGNLCLESYLTNYPLFGAKYLDFKSWTEVLNLFKAGKFDHKSNMQKVIHIKSNMNDKRTVFVWDHLKNFYSLNE